MNFGSLEGRTIVCAVKTIDGNDLCFFMEMEKGDTVHTAIQEFAEGSNMEINEESNIEIFGMCPSTEEAEQTSHILEREIVTRKITALKNI